MTIEINTIVKATASVLLVSVKGTNGAEAFTFKIEGTSKGVPGQFDKLIDLINQSPEDQDLIIEAGLLKGVFKALGENSKDAGTFKFVLALKGWSLMQVAEDWTIYRGNGTGIVLTKNRYDWGVKKELNEVADYTHEYIPTRWEQIVGDELGVDPSKLPKLVYPVVVYTGPVQLPTVIELGVVYSEISVETDQGVKVCKYLYTDTGVITCKGTRFESVEALTNVVKAAFKVKTVEVSETTQQEENTMKPKTFCQMMKSEWIPSRETWIAQTLINKMRATWTSGKYPTDDRQKEFMKSFVAQVATLPQGVEMPNRAFLTAYDLVVEQLTGVKPETPKFVSSITGEEAASSFEGEHTAQIVTQTITRKFEPVALPEHLKKSQVKDLPKPDTRSHLEALQDLTVKALVKLTGDVWDLKDLANLESICESFDGEQQYQVHVNMIRMWIQENTQEGKGTLVHTQEKPCEDAEEMSEGKVTIKNMLGKRYTIEVFFNSDKTLWINTKSGESFNTLSDLCMVHDKEYFSHEFFVENKLVEDKENKHYFPRSDYKIGDILCAIYEEHFNPVHHDDEEEYITGILVVKNGFEYDGKFYKTLQELCNELSEGKCKDVVDVLVNL